MERSIDEILTDTTEPEAIEQTETEVIIDPPSGIADTPPRLRDEHGRFVAKDEETGVENPEAEPSEPVPPTVQDRLPQAEFAALKDERRKRQELEDRLRQYDEYFAQQQAQQAPQQVPDMFEDPDAFKTHLVEQVRRELMQELTPTLNQHRSLTRAEMSEIAARQKYEDYDDTVEVFKEAMAVNPFLLTQLQQAADPAVYAYNAGKQFQAAKAYGAETPPSRDELKAQLREELIAELNLTPSKAPSTLADGRSVGSRSGPAWSGPRSIGDILG